MPGISQWDAAIADLANDDLFGITDASDPTQSVNGSSKKLTWLQLLSSLHKRLQNVSATSGIINLNCALYHTFVVTITGGAEFSFQNLDNGQTVAVVVTNGGTNFTWGSTIKWPDGEEPDLSAAGTDRLVFQRLSATVIHGSLAGQAYA